MVGPKIPREHVPIERYSMPFMVEKTRLRTVYCMDARRATVMPGRELMVAYNNAIPLVEGFEMNYAYFVRFLEDGNVAGNHYHLKKKELFVPVVGEFTVQLEDIVTKEQEELKISAKDYAALYIPLKVSHKVTAAKAGNVLLVIANTPASDADEIHYEVIMK